MPTRAETRMPSRPPATLEALLLELELRLMDPEERRNPERLADLLDDGFVEHGTSGRVFTRAEVLALLRTAPDRRFAVEEFRVRELAPGCALATFRTLADGVPSLRSSIWCLREGRWKILFHQGTPAAT